MTTVGPRGCVCVGGEGVAAAMEASRCHKGAAGGRYREWGCFLVLCVLLSVHCHIPPGKSAHSFTSALGSLRAGLGEEWVLTDTRRCISRGFIHLSPTLIHTNTQTHTYTCRYTGSEPDDSCKEEMEVERFLVG